MGKGAVLVQGPKWCGKTTTARQVAENLLDLGNTAELTNALETFQVIPMKLFEGAVMQLYSAETYTISEIPLDWNVMRFYIEEMVIMA